MDSGGAPKVRAVTWWHRGVPKAELLSHIRPGRQLPGFENVVRAAKRTFLPDERPGDQSGVAVRCTLRRTLVNGFEFECELRGSLSLDSDSEGPKTIDLAVAPEHKPPWSLRAALDDDGQATVDFVSSNGETSTQLPEDLSVGLGDLQIGELLALWRAIASRKPRPIGIVSDLGSHELLVFEVPFSTAVPRRVAPALQTAGALVHVDRETFELRSIRMLNSEEMVIRRYEDFSWAGPESALHFRVTSFPDGSHSLFCLHLDDASAERP
jgi:hypothetical protein